MSLDLRLTNVVTKIDLGPSGALPHSEVHNYTLYKALKTPFSAHSLPKGT